MDCRKLGFIKCECGRDVSVRALVRHLKGTVNSHSQEFIDICIDLIELAKKERWAWKVSEGVEAKGDFYWCTKILNKELSMSELTFISPRPLGQNTPMARKKISEERMGKGNPSLINKPSYDIQEIKKTAVSLFYSLDGDPRRFKKLSDELRKLYPDYGYSFVEMFPYHSGKRGHSRINLTLSYLIDKTVEWIVSEKAQDRGKLIRIGQQKSPKYLKMLNAAKGSLKGRVTLSQRILFNMVQSLDEQAVLEKQIDYKDTWKSYDIFSPNKNILFEMHGRIWHDLTECPKNLIDIVTKNVANDKIKEILAKDHGYELIVLWDDETADWESRLEDIYGKRPKKYEEALCEETDKKRKERSI